MNRNLKFDRDMTKLSPDNQNLKTLHKLLNTIYNTPNQTQSEQTYAKSSLGLSKYEFVGIPYAFWHYDPDPEKYEVLIIKRKWHRFGFKNKWVSVKKTRRRRSSHIMRVLVLPQSDPTPPPKPLPPIDHFDKQSNVSRTYRVLSFMLVFTSYNEN